jgi:hypothetical protein
VSLSDQATLASVKAQCIDLDEIGRWRVAEGM